MRHAAAFGLMLLATGCDAAVLSTRATSSVHQVRLARRAEIWHIAQLLDTSFAANAAERSVWEVLLARGRLALDLERRMTPWDWCRHQQLVAEDVLTGRVVGFAELWAENAAACGVSEATTPQPVVFNLCVASDFRRRGVALHLLSECEAIAAAWGEPGMYLKVEVGNEGAIQLYERYGFESLGTREPAEMEAWMARWKGGRRPLQLMKKSVVAPPAPSTLNPSLDWPNGLSASSRDSAAPKPRFSELEVSFAQVRKYEAAGAGGQAYLWFALLIMRNAGQLAPIYGTLGGASAVLGLLTYTLLLEFAHSA